MSRFEYLSVLISIVLALGIADVTICWGRILQNRENIRFSWLHAFWSLVILLIMIQFWWGFWNYRIVESWPLPSLVLVVSEAIALVLAAIVLGPSQPWSESIDLEQLYYQSARPFFLVGAFALIQMSVVDTFVLGSPGLFTENIVRAVAAAACLFVGLSTASMVHRAFPVIATGLLIIFFLNMHLV